MFRVSDLQTWRTLPWLYPEIKHHIPIQCYQNCNKPPRHFPKKKRTRWLQNYNFCFKTFGSHPFNRNVAGNVEEPINNTTVNCRHRRLKLMLHKTALVFTKHLDIISTKTYLLQFNRVVGMCLFTFLAIKCYELNYIFYFILNNTKRSNTNLFARVIFYVLYKRSLSDKYGVVAAPSRHTWSL